MRILNLDDLGGDFFMEMKKSPFHHPFFLGLCYHSFIARC